MKAEAIRLLHLADVHIGIETYGRMDPETGLNSRVVDFLRRLSEVIDYALEQEVDVCLVAGDVYKNQRPHPTYQREFARRLKRLADAGVLIVLLVGNHDMPSADRAASSVDIFGVLGVPNVIVAGSEEVFHLICRRGQPLQVAAIPYPQRTRLLAYDRFRQLSIKELDDALQEMIGENIKHLADQVRARPEIPAVLTAHLSLSGAQVGSERSVMIGSDVVVQGSALQDDAWSYVALGHIHKHQCLNPGRQPPVVYAGSLERVDFGEEGEQKGFVVATIIPEAPTEWRFVPVAARPFKTIRVDVRRNSDPLTAVLDAVDREELDEAIVRVIVKAREEQEALLDEREIQRALSGAKFVAGVQRDIEREYRHRMNVAQAEALTPRQALGHYLDSKDVPSERKQTLLTLADEIITGSEG